MRILCFNQFNQFTPLLDRFNASYTPEPFSGCWLWDAVCYRDHSQTKPSHWVNSFRPMINRKGKTVLASRIAYELFVGPIPHGALICHRCNTPLCVNPDHLYAGSAKTNAADRIAKRKLRTAINAAKGNSGSGDLSSRQRKVFPKEACIR